MKDKYAANHHGKEIALLLCILVSMGVQITSFGQRNIDTTYKNNIVPSPSFTYAPETDVVIGAFALYQFKGEKTDYETRPSHMMAYLAASFYGQITASIEYNLFLPPRESWFIDGFFQYKRWPEMFYGIGPNSDEDSLTIADYQIITIHQKAYKNLGRKLFAGLQLRYMNSYDIKYYDEGGEEINAPDVTGKNGGAYFGFGFALLKDERNSVLTPTQDYYLELSNYLYLEALGSKTQYTTFLLDVRKYINFNTGSKHVLALQGKALLTFGEPPFMELAKMGGKAIMRGYLEGRYRDKQYIQLQAEYRVNIIGRFGATCFAGTGNVMPTINEFEIQYTKAAVGFGFRFNINRKDPANVRIDFGYGFEKNASGVYVTFGEAF